MVKETLNYYLFAYHYFMRISRIYATLIFKCDLFGNYDSFGYIPNKMKIYRHKKFFMDIASCSSNAEKPEGFKNCKNFCERFHPTVFNEDLEGHLSDYLTYHIGMKEESDRL